MVDFLGSHIFFVKFKFPTEFLWIMSLIASRWAQCPNVLHNILGIFILTVINQSQDWTILPFFSSDGLSAENEIHFVSVSLDWSHLISEVKQHWARMVLGWETAWDSWYCWHGFLYRCLLNPNGLSEIQAPDCIIPVSISCGGSLKSAAISRCCWHGFVYQWRLETLGESRARGCI